MNKTLKNVKGITLVALVITIIILLILAGVSIAMLAGEDGLLRKAIEAKEQAKIKEYAEKIELIKTELKIKNEGYQEPSIGDLKEEFRDKKHENWVDSAKDTMDNEIEKLELTTKEGYIFYVTGTTTEYKGKGGKIVDTSDLTRDNVIRFEVKEDTGSGKKVKIINDTGKDYYKIKYSIDESEEWKEIKSGDEVEVKYGTTIKAKLTYGPNEGIESSLTVNHTEPTVSVSNEDLTKTTRKTNKPLANLFKVTWGSEGTGKVIYQVTGKLKFKNKEFSSNKIENISELELGTYQIYCYVATPSQIKNNQATFKGEWKKTINITELANTTVTNASNSSVSAKAIYSEYDLAYFRDLVNGGNSSINGKVMKDINLSNVCSESIGNWNAIGYVSDTEEKMYEGIFDGNGKTISKLYFNGTLNNSYGLIGLLGDTGIIKNITTKGEIIANFTNTRALGGICGRGVGNIYDSNNYINITRTASTARSI